MNKIHETYKEGEGAFDEKFESMFEHNTRTELFKQYQLQSHNKQQTLKLLESILESVEGRKKGVKELFPNSNISIPTEELAMQVMSKELYNKALSEVSQELKEAINLIKQ